MKIINILMVLATGIMFSCNQPVDLKEVNLLEKWDTIRPLANPH